jgi:hypothetical protein
LHKSAGGGGRRRPSAGVGGHWRLGSEAVVSLGVIPVHRCTGAQVHRQSGDRLEGDPLAVRLLSLCDPAVESSSREGLRRLWLAAKELGRDLRAAVPAVSPAAV